MKKIITSICLAAVLVFGGTAIAQDVTPIGITADEAFDAVQTQTDPISGEKKVVALIDVRSRAEYFWVGAVCEVTNIETIRGSFVPDLGKAKLMWSGRFLSFNVDRRHRIIPVRYITKVELSPIATNIPFRFWNEKTGTIPKETAKDIRRFRRALKKFKRQNGIEVAIFFCRSGKRTESCTGLGADIFDAVYEIDDPEGGNALGGFEGSSYGDVYNSYRGFPGRLTEIQDFPSVSWKDAGLPIKIGLQPPIPKKPKDDDDDDDDEEDDD